MRIQRDRVREVEAGERAGAALRQRRKASVGGVDVQPHASFPADLGKLAQLVDGARVRAPGARGDEERMPSGAQVRVDRGGDRLRSEAVLAARRQDAELVLAEAEHAPRHVGARQFAGDVAFYELRTPAAISDRGGDTVARLRVTVDHVDRRARLGEAVADRLADPATAAGDDGHFSRE